MHGRPWVLLVALDGAVEDAAKRANVLRLGRPEMRMAADPRQARAMLSRALADNAPPALVIIDLHALADEGSSLLALVKRDGIARAIPLVALASESADGLLDWAYRNHVNSCVRKPGDAREMSETLACILSWWVSRHVSGMPCTTVCSKFQTTARASSQA